VDRSRITSQTATTSGGVSDAELSRAAGGAALSGRETTQVESTLAAARVEEPPAAGSRERSARSSEEVRRVIDQHMGAIFAIYNRALRQNPALQGKVVVRLVIEPAGNITDARIVSSELDDPELEARLIARILLISFPAAEVARTTVNYTFDFLPQ
jgi:TonB family protein